MAQLSNSQIAELLRRYAALLELRGDNAFRTLAYRRGADAIADLDHPALHLRAEELRQVEGIGPGISAIVAEIASTGTFRAYTALAAAIPPSVADFTSIPGVGTKTAMRLFQTLGVTTLDELQAAADAGRIAETKGLGPRVARTVIAGLAQLAVYRGRHALGTALPLGQRLVRALRDAGFARVNLAGSLRRMAETVGDIDILVGADDAASVFQRFADLPQTGAVLRRERLAEDDETIQVTIQGDLCAHLGVVPPARWGTALVRWTGSPAHLDALRAPGAPDPFAMDYDSEEAFYAALGLPVIPPELREGRDEVAAAREGRLPALIRVGDLRGDLHAHSTWSDGSATIREMAEAAIARGYAYLSVSDHTQSLTIANGLNETRLREQWQEIDRLNSELAPFRLLKSAEVEIRRDGALDFPDEVLASFDIVIASLHTGLRGDRAAVTERLLGAIRNPHVDIIAHPSGRIVGGRGGADYDWEAIYAAAWDTGTALEINASPERLDLNDIHARQALDAGIRLTIDTDAHHPSNLDLLPYGVAVARRAWCETGQVLNTRPLDELLAWARQRA